MFGRRKDKMVMPKERARNIVIVRQVGKVGDGKSSNRKIRTPIGK